MPRQAAQRGQALLLVLVFVAAFLLITWAGLRLAGQAFLASNSVQSDTRATYALDGGIAQGLAAANLLGGCFSLTLPTFTTGYPSGNLTVTTTMAPAAGCTNANPAYDLTVTASNTNRTARAQVYQTGAGGLWAIRWQAYQ